MNKGKTKQTNKHSTIEENSRDYFVFLFQISFVLSFSPVLLCRVIKNQTKPIFFLSYLLTNGTNEYIYFFVCASLTIDEIFQPVFVLSSLYSEYRTTITKHVRFFILCASCFSCFSLLLLLLCSFSFFCVFVSRCTHNFQDKSIRNIELFSCERSVLV